MYIKITLHVYISQLYYINIIINRKKSTKCELSQFLTKMNNFASLTK